jgi:GxxExxY protein
MLWKDMTHILHKELSYTINGILFEVHNDIGRQASEGQVCDLIEQKLKEMGIPYRREYVVMPTRDGEKKGRHRVDFLIDDKIVLEIKYRQYLVREDYMQLKRYLRELNTALGILVNFRDQRLNPKRVLNGGGKE